VSRLHDAERWSAIELVTPTKWNESALEVLGIDVRPAGCGESRKILVVGMIHRAVGGLPPRMSIPGW